MIDVRIGPSWATDAIGRGKGIGEVATRSKGVLTLRQSEEQWTEALDDAMWQVDIESDRSIPAEAEARAPAEPLERAVRALRAAAPVGWLEKFDNQTPAAMRHIR